MAQPFLTLERDIANDLTGAIMLNFKDCLSWIYMHTELATIDQLSFDENVCRSVSESKQQQYNFDKYAELFPGSK